MSTPKIEDYLLTLQKSKLIPRERLAKALEEFKQLYQLRTRKEVTVDKLSVYLIEQKLLTEWQHKKLVAGHFKGFYLGKYRLLSHLGSGGMSNVYLAEHQHMRRRAAIKVLPRSLSDNQAYLKRFYLEARAIAALDHPNIVHAYGFDNEGTTHYMAMQFIEGMDLQRKVAEEGPLDPITAAKYIRQAANGLAHAHERGLIHRDMKPANLMVDQEETVKLMDLGLAQMSFHESGLTTEQKGGVLGTADYLAPEQAIDSHNVDHRADLYSLGATFYFLLTGSPPFPKGTIAQRLMKHQLEEPTPVDAFRSDVPEELIDILRTLMAKKREQRYESAEEVVDVLGDWLAEQGEEDELFTYSGPKSTTRRQGGPPVPTVVEASWEVEEEREPFEPDSDTGALVLSDVFESSGGHSIPSAVGVGTYRRRKSKLPTYLAVASSVILTIGACFYFLTGDSGSAANLDPSVLVVKLPPEAKEEVSVKINDQLQKVDTSSGTVKIQLSPGKYTVSVHRKGYVPFERRVTISKEPIPPLQAVFLVSPEAQKLAQLAEQAEEVQNAAESAQKYRLKRELQRELLAFQHEFAGSKECAEASELLDQLLAAPVGWDRLSSANLPAELQNQPNLGPLVQVFAAEPGLKLGAPSIDLCYHPDGSQIVTFAPGKNPQLWQEGQMARAFSAPEQEITLRESFSGFVGQGTQLVQLGRTTQNNGIALVWNRSGEYHGACAISPPVRQFNPRWSPVGDAKSFLVARDPQTLERWDTEKLTSEEIPLKAMEGTFVSGCLSPDGQHVARMTRTPKGQSVLYLTNLTTGENPKPLSIQSLLQHMSFDQEGNLFLAESNGTIYRLAAGTTQLQPLAPSFNQPFSGLAVSEDGSTLVAFTRGLVAWWSLPGLQLKSVSRLGVPVVRYALHPKAEDLLFLPPNSQKVLRITSASGANGRHVYPVAAMRFGLDASTLLTAGIEGRLCRWTATQSTPSTSPLGLETVPLRFSGDAAWLGRVQGNGQLELLELSRSRRVKLPGVTAQTSQAFAFHPDSGHFMVGHTREKPTLSSGTLKPSPKLNTSLAVEATVDALAINDSGDRLACSIYNPKTKKSEVTVRYPESCQPLITFPSVDGKSHFLRFDLSGLRLACCQAKGKVTVWSAPDAIARETLCTIDHAGKNVLSAVFTPDGSKLITQTLQGPNSSSVHIWQLPQSGPSKARAVKEFQLPLADFPGFYAVFMVPGFTVAPLEISPEGRYLAAANLDGTICLYRLAEPPKSSTSQLSLRE